LLPSLAKQNIAIPQKTRLTGSGKEIPADCIPELMFFGASKEKIREYGKTTIEKQVPKIKIIFFIITLDGFVKSRHSGENRSPVNL
jgi:hypothetical protein